MNLSTKQKQTHRQRNRLGVAKRKEDAGGVDQEFRIQFSSVQSLSHVRLFATPWIAARPPCPSPTPRVYPNSYPSSQWCHPAISSCCPLLLPPPIPPSIRVFSDVSRYKLLHMEWINNKVLLYSTENYIQYPMINYNGKYNNIYTNITELLCCSRNQHNTIHQLYVN